MAGTEGGAPRLRDVVAGIVRVCRARWGTLLVAALIVFVPLALVDVGSERLREPLADSELGAGAGLAALLAAFGAALAALVGEVVYAGIVARVVVAEREGHEPSVRELLSELPLLRLIVVDALLALIVAAGFLALIVPGFVFLVWFALVAPAVEIERLGVSGSFRRSRELVRGRFWLVCGLVFPTLIAEGVLSSAAASISWWGLGDGFLGDWVSAALTNVLTSPLYAVAVTALFLELRDERRALSRADGSSPGTPPRWRRRRRLEATP